MNVTQRQQPAAYPDAAIRGQIRAWKTELAQHYQQFDRFYANGPAWGPVAEALMSRGSAKGRQRALQRLAQGIGPGATLEGWRAKPDPLAVWSILKPRDAVVVVEDEPIDPGLLQDCVAVEYILAGAHPDRKDQAVLSSGLWTIEVPDHALGRAMSARGLGVHPRTIIREAHLNLLAMANKAVISPTTGFDDVEFLVRSGPGGFACRWRHGEDVSSRMQMSVHVRASTWLADDMLHDDQVTLVGDGAPGERLCDGWLVPMPRRRIVPHGQNMALVEVWGAGLPPLRQVRKGVG